MIGISEDDPNREEKLQKRREKMKAKLEEAKEFRWNSKDDEDFEKMSEEFINDTIAGLEKDILVEFKNGETTTDQRSKRSRSTIGNRKRAYQQRKG